MDHNLKQISSLKCEPEAPWDGIIKELILEERIVRVFSPLLASCINWMCQQLCTEPPPSSSYSSSW